MHKYRRCPRLLLVGPAFSGGGAEQQFYTLFRYLFDGQVDACILLNDYDSVGDDNRGKLYSLRWSGRLSYPKSIYRMRRILAFGQYDIVMSFGRYPNLILWASLLFNKIRPKTVMTEITRPYKALTTPEFTIKNHLIYNIMKRAYQTADIILGNSRDGLNESVRYFGIPSYKTRLVPNIINTDYLESKAREVIFIPWVTDKKIIIAVSRLVEIKRLDTLIDSFARSKYYNECVLVIVGDGPELLSLQQQSIELGISDSVYFTGWLCNPFPIVKRAFAYVLCSEYEGYSNSLLEAMFLRVPVITSYCSTDVIEICKQGAALGFEVGNIRQLTTNLELIIESDELRNSLIDKAKYFCKIHEKESALTFYETLLSNLE